MCVYMCEYHVRTGCLFVMLLAAVAATAIVSFICLLSHFIVALSPNDERCK